MIVLVGAAGPAAATPTAPTAAPAAAQAARAAAYPSDVKVYWSKINRVTGASIGSNQAATIYSESTVKIWLAADYLRVHPNPSSSIKSRLRLMVVFSDDSAGEYFYRQNGSNATISRMISTCKLTDTKVFSGWWSKTQISARDLVKLGLCVVNGKTGAGKPRRPGSSTG